MSAARKRGRPRISDDGDALVSVAIWMRPAMREALRQAAKGDEGEASESMSSLVRRILVRAVELQDYL